MESSSSLRFLPNDSYIQDVRHQASFNYNLGVAGLVFSVVLIVVAARFGVVLGKGGGAIQKMIPPFRFGLGGVFGSGRQVMSWIAMDDLVGAIDHVIQTETLSGPINFVAPQSVTNRELTKTLGKALHRPTFFRLPKWLLGFIFGPGASNFLASTDAQPERLLESGYHFQYPNIERTIQKIVCE